MITRFPPARAQCPNKRRLISNTARQDIYKKEYQKNKYICVYIDVEITFLFFCLFLVRFARDVIRDPLVVSSLVCVCVCVCRVCVHVCILWIAQSPIRVQKKSIARETRHARLNYVFRLLLLLLLQNVAFYFCHLRSGTNNVCILIPSITLPSPRSLTVSRKRHCRLNDPAIVESIIVWDTLLLHNKSVTRSWPTPGI